VRKNWNLITFLDNELDHSRYQLTVIGRIPEGTSLNHTSHVPPLDQAHLAQMLRVMDIFVAPSWNECFSNAEAQALASGIPVLALRNSSHPEVVKTAGRLFNGPEDVLQELEALVANYPLYAAAVQPLDIDDIAMQYLQAAGLI
jgi:glycosyltransferase involved in cell wall biosynthesis